MSRITANITVQESLTKDASRGALVEKSSVTFGARRDRWKGAGHETEEGSSRGRDYG